MKSELQTVTADPLGNQGRKVLLTVDTVGGVWTYGIDLARALSRQGVEILLACIGPQISEQQREDARGIANLRLEFLEARLEWMVDPWDDVSMTRRWLRQLEEEFQPGLIHLNQYCYTTAGFSAPTLVVAHSCVYSWFAAVKGEEPGPEWERYRASVAEGIAAASGVSGISDELLDGMERWYGPFKRCPAVVNGRDLSGFDERAKQPFVFSAGRLWDEAKNIALLDQVAESVSWPIKVAGDSAPPDGASSRATLHLEELGALDRAEMVDTLCDAAIYAAPALYEPFGLAILEAAAAGCALVLADIPSLKASWEGAALFVPPRNAQCWANALKQLIDDELMRTQLGELARQRSQSAQYHPTHMTDSYLRIYDSIQNAPREAEINQIAS